MGLLKEADFIPSEEWFGEYMGQQGLRYALNKTPDEVKSEGTQSEMSEISFDGLEYPFILKVEGVEYLEDLEYLERHGRSRGSPRFRRL